MPQLTPPRDIHAARGYQRTLLSVAAGLRPSHYRAVGLSDPFRVSKVLAGESSLRPDEVEVVVQLFAARVRTIFGPLRK